MNSYVPVWQHLAAGRSYELGELADREGILSIELLHSDGTVLVISFDNHLAYSKLDEGDAMKALSRVSECGVAGKSFYRVDESGFVSWFVEQSYNVRKSDSLLHFAIHSANDVVDVIALGEPKFDVQSN